MLGFFLRIVSYDSRNQVCHEVISRPVCGMLYLAYVLQFVIDGLDDDPFPKQCLIPN